ncbi:hypothetical protein REIS_0694 [Rickettsia endosymbiont of Ixodes scapularis]|nr:hypothetical protein REIS_0694 [Rickettsia endosymbiont of Ixodes scapularis]
MTQTCFPSHATTPTTTHNDDLIFTHLLNASFVLRCLNYG